MSTAQLTDRNGNLLSVETLGLPDANVAFAHAVIDASGHVGKVDVTGNQATESGGQSSALNQNAAAVIKASPGRLRRIVIIAPGSASGAFTFNDCTTVGAAAAANQIFTLPYNGAANVAGYVITLDWPCALGIVLSAVPGGGSPICAVAYD